MKQIPPYEIKPLVKCELWSRMFLWNKSAKGKNPNHMNKIKKKQDAEGYVSTKKLEYLGTFIRNFRVCALFRIFGPRRSLRWQHSSRKLYRRCRGLHRQTHPQRKSHLLKSNSKRSLSYRPLWPGGHFGYGFHTMEAAISLTILKHLIIKRIFREPHNDLPSIFGISSRADHRFIFWRQAEDCEVVDLELRHRSYRDRTMWGIKKWRTRPTK